MLGCADALEQPSCCDVLHLAEIQDSASISRGIIGGMIEDIRASVPCILGRVDANGSLKEGGEPSVLTGQSLLWPLNMTMLYEYADTKD